MNVDNVTIVWALIIASFGFLGAMMALMYYADKKSDGKSKKRKR